MISFFSVLFYMVICAVTDMKKTVISLPLSILAGTAGIILSIGGFTNIHSLSDFFISQLPCIFLIITSLISKSAVGMGDCLIFFVTGCFYSFAATCSIFFYGMLLSGITGFFLLILHRYSLKNVIPFAPFVLISFIVYHIVEHG